MPRSFIGWDQPLPRLVADWLWGRTEGRVRDFSKWLVLVPTRESGRILREYLASKAEREGRALLPPTIYTPDSLYALTTQGVPLAGKLEKQFTWKQVLSHDTLKKYPELFPELPNDADYRWAHGFSESVEAVKVLLAEAALLLEDARDQLSFDRERWRALCELNGFYCETLETLGFKDSFQKRIENVDTAINVDGFDQIAICCVPDIMPAVQRMLEPCLENLKILIYAPEAHADGFDAWGLPVHAYWKSFCYEHLEASLTVHASPDDMQRTLAESISKHGYQGDDQTLGLGDQTWEPSLEAAMTDAGLPVYAPEGFSAVDTFFYKQLKILARVVQDRRLDDVCLWLSQSPVLDYLKRCGMGGGLSDWLSEADALRGRCLTQTIDDVLVCAQRHESTGKQWQGVVDALSKLLKLFEQKSFAQGLMALFKTLYGVEQWVQGEHYEEREAPVVLAFFDILERVEALESHEALSAADSWALVLDELSDVRVYKPHDVDSIELKGWLELLWDDAPRLDVGGFFEGSVPDQVTADTFLPESAREQLGLRTNAQRYARDAYILQALLASRQTRLHHCLFNEDGEPLKPSRLLFHCEDAQLPRRVRQVFDAPPIKRQTPPPTQGWTFSPPVLTMPERFNPTQFRDYLKDPLDFYLKHILKMKAVASEVYELDAGGYGELCHQAIEVLGRDASMRDCTDAERMSHYLENALLTLVKRRFGRSWSIPLQIQMETMRERLRAVSVILARERAEGWLVREPEHIEWHFKGEHALRIGGYAITGKIDRIEFNENTGAWRIVDFKTGDKTTDPEQAHLQALRGQQTYWLDEAVLPDGKKRWKDLQLPLYQMAARSALGIDAEVAYVIMPSAVSETRLALWSGLNAEMISSAEACAGSIIEAVAAQRFVPDDREANMGYPSLENSLLQSVRVSLDADFVRAYKQEVGNG